MPARARQTATDPVVASETSASRAEVSAELAALRAEVAELRARLERVEQIVT